jgi:hypothetical protein
LHEVQRPSTWVRSAWKPSRGFVSLHVLQVFISKGSEKEMAPAVTVSEARATDVPPVTVVLATKIALNETLLKENPLTRKVFL